MVVDGHKAEPFPASRDGLGASGPPTGPALLPMNVTGLVVTKADLVKALRVYVPQLVDIAPLDGERFLLGFTPIPQRDS